MGSVVFLKCSADSALMKISIIYLLLSFGNVLKCEVNVKMYCGGQSNYCIAAIFVNTGKQVGAPTVPSAVI
jgi:hypothetical protein